MTQRSSELKRAWDAFERGEFDAAIDAFLVALDTGAFAAPDLTALVELLRDRGRDDDAARAIDRAVVRGAVPIEAIVDWRARQLDLISPPVFAANERLDAALSLLEALALRGSVSAWLSIMTTDRLATIESASASATDRLLCHEQLLLAPPETGWPDRARVTIEEIGVTDAALARAAERLLHAAGDSAAAYRVERVRRSARRDASPPLPPAAMDDVDLHGRVVVIAGGHPALRALIGRDLKRSGAERIESIPSATEGSRVERDIQAVVGGADLVVILVRQIAHATSAQVKRAGRKTGVPVAIAESSGISGVRRAVAALTAFRADPTLDA